MMPQGFNPDSGTLDHDLELHTKMFAGDDKLFVQFYDWFIKDDDATAAQQRPVYNPSVFVRIITPGNRDNIIDRPVQEGDKIRFAARWERYSKGKGEQITGTRLEEWPLLARSTVEEYKFLGIYTVEQLSEVGEQALSKVPGMNEAKSRAVRWLQAVKDTESAAKLAAEVEAKDAEMTLLKNQIADLTALVHQYAPKPNAAEDAANAKVNSAGNQTANGKK